MADEFCLKMPDFHVTFRDLLHAVNLWHGTDGFTSPPKEGVLRIFFTPKNPTASVGFEPANLGTKGQHATSRPPKPFDSDLKKNIKFMEVTLTICSNKILDEVFFFCVFSGLGLQLLQIRIYRSTHNKITAWILLFLHSGTIERERRADWYDMT